MRAQRWERLAVDRVLSVLLCVSMVLSCGCYRGISFLLVALIERFKSTCMDGESSMSGMLSLVTPAGSLEKSTLMVSSWRPPGSMVVGNGSKKVQPHRGIAPIIVTGVELKECTWNGIDTVPEPVGPVIVRFFSSTYTAAPRSLAICLGNTKWNKTPASNIAAIVMLAQEKFLRLG